MNINSGGPHILLFERDQQLTGLLTSEFQLAGYDCHAARTAVEVFDAIARYPIRLVLVNLAQAAANRREFWVALDAQRRGRGVQVFTFRCMNLAGYGPDDPDDRSRPVLTDMEVDGMLGVMNLVDAVRARIPGPTSASFSRLNSGTALGGQNAPKQENVDRTNRQPEADPRAAPMTGLPTAPLTSNMGPNFTGAPSVPVSQAEQGIGSRTGMPTPTFTDKIRAVIYPGNRSYSPTPEANWAPHSAPPAPRNASSPEAALRPQVRPNLNATGTGGPALERETFIQDPTVRDAGAPPPPATPFYRSAPQTIQSTGGAPNTLTEATGLEQLSRMVRENPPEEAAPQAEARVLAQPAPLPERQSPYKGPQTDQVTLDEVIAANDSPMPPMPQPSPVMQAWSAPPPLVEPARPISDLSLRASPIEDLPRERASERYAAPAGTPPSQDRNALSSTMPIPAINPTPVSMPRQPVPRTPVRNEVAEEVRAQPAQERRDGLKSKSGDDTSERLKTVETKRDEVVDRLLEEQSRAVSPAPRKRSEPQATSEDVLLDIVQSLPPVTALPTPPPATPVLSGRATRSLGNVLLEGHLVPQHRLDVAQHIQRMLHGVDMNYQLGEILLMFKLLTPDQLLAASLVSYGLISASQISALGRIRQELHLMGLEYDLESLLVLFRILTPDQLREVRASWSS